MVTRRRHAERHRTQRIGWLRAAVLGANDGIVSTASLMVGVAAASASHGNILLTGVAGLVAGAMSMASGEYVSVHSQASGHSAHHCSAQLFTRWIGLTTATRRVYRSHAVGAPLSAKCR